MRTDCIIWDKSIGGPGYGQKYVSLGFKKYKIVGAHRWTWEQTHGPIPEGMMVLHHCDNKACVNLKHLYLGTGKDNARDAMARNGDNVLKGLKRDVWGKMPYDRATGRFVERS